MPISAYSIRVTGMKDEHCVRFLQWALPKLRMCWPGFRKVRKQVCKRIDRRLNDLDLASVEDYMACLEADPDEWRHLDSLCRITISRFCRDSGLFAILAQEILPALAHRVRERGESALRVWSAGCASGEEPYTLAITWAMELQSHFPGITLDIVATDVEPQMIRRANDARYRFSSLKDLPDSWRERCFVKEADIYLLKPEYRRNIKILEQDIRQRRPDGLFDLVLCRNLVFTYFDDALQLEMAKHIVDSMHDGAALVLGTHEHLPKGVPNLTVWFVRENVYRKDSSD